MKICKNCLKIRVLLKKKTFIFFSFNLTHKCNKYELAMLDKYIIKDMDVILVLNDVVDITALLENNKSTKYIFINN